MNDDEPGEREAADLATVERLQAETAALRAELERVGCKYSIK